MLETQAQQQPGQQALAVVRFLMRLPLNLFTDRPRFSVQQTLTDLATSSITCPNIDQQLLATYFSR